MTRTYIYVLLLSVASLGAGSAQNRSVLSGVDTPAAAASRWQISFRTGGSHMLASTDRAAESLHEMGVPLSDAKDYYRQFKQGIHAGLDVHHIFPAGFGLGAKYILFHSSARMSSAVSPGADATWAGSVRLDERLQVHYTGPSVLFSDRFGRGSKFGYTATLSAGYAHYRDAVRFDPRSDVTFPNTLATGHALGTNIEASLEYHLSRHFSAGLNLGVFNAAFRTLRLTSGQNVTTVRKEKGEYENVSRIDWGLVLRFTPGN
jgi:hypothetical protein